MAPPNKPLAFRLEQGVDLPGAIESAVEQLDVEFCDVSGFGAVEWIEILAAGAEGARRLVGPLDLIELRGRLRRVAGVKLADYVCTVSRATDSGVELLGGRLVAARAAFVELTVVELEAAAIRSRAETAAEPSATATPVAEQKPPISGRWAEALAESKRQERHAQERGWDWDSDEEDLRPTRGDIVIHRQFGRCQVVRMDDEHISLRKPDGRVVQLGLSILEFSAAGTEQGRPIYDVAVKRG